MSERSKRLSRILNNQESRAAYIFGKLAVLVSSQVRSLRLKSNNPPMPRQADLANAIGTKQSRISMFETPGGANITLETLASIAAGLKTGVIVKFVPFHEMLYWEKNYSQQDFDVTPRLDNDIAFIDPIPAEQKSEKMAAGSGTGTTEVNAEKKPPASDRMSSADSWDGRSNAASAGTLA